MKSKRHWTNWAENIKSNVNEYGKSKTPHCENLNTQAEVWFKIL